MLDMLLPCASIDPDIVTNLIFLQYDLLCCYLFIDFEFDIIVLIHWSVNSFQHCALLYDSLFHQDSSRPKNWSRCLLHKHSLSCRLLLLPVWRVWAAPRTLSQQPPTLMRKMRLEFISWLTAMMCLQTLTNCRLVGRVSRVVRPQSGKNVGFRVGECGVGGSELGKWMYGGEWEFILANLGWSIKPTEVGPMWRKYYYILL